MADDLVQLEDGQWMRIDRRLWDALGRFKFSERELIVLKKIIRWTYGCIAKADESKDHGRYCLIDKLERAADAMGLHHSALTITLQALHKKRVIYALLETKPKVIVFNKHWPSWDVPLRSKYIEKADNEITARNLNYSGIDEAMGEEAFRQMKKAYQFNKELNDSLSKPYRIDKELNELDSKELNDSLRKNPEEANKIKNPQPPIDNTDKDIRSSSSSIIDINTGSQEPYQEEEEEELANAKEEEKAKSEEAALYVMKKIEKLWPGCVVQPNTLLMTTLEDIAQYHQEAIDEAFKAAKKQRVRKGNLNWILERLRNPGRYGVKDYAELESREERRRIKEQLQAAGEEINKAYGGENGKFQPYRGMEEDDAVIDSLLTFTTLEEICSFVAVLRQEEVNAPDVLPRLESEFAKF